MSALAVATLCATLPLGGNAQQTGSGYTVPRTAWGDPDLTGKWPGTDMVGVPMQREERFGTRNVLTDEEFVERQNRAVQQEELDNADFELENAASTPGGDVGGAVSPPPHWLERGQPQRQASLIVDPPNGRMPAFTQQAQERQAALRDYRASRGPADSYTDRSNYDRCITRGLPGSMMPAIYGNSYEITQAPGVVAIRYEMIHETRIIPLDGRPAPAKNIRSFMGFARGRFEGDTLVVETTNFDPRSAYQNSNADVLKVVERFTPVAGNKVEWTVRFEDATTWTRPWAFQMNLTKDPTQVVFEYGCHEGNHGLRNILSAARAEEAAAAKK
jgi:hypothetical protein